MAIFDGRLIDPTEKDLVRALGKAMRSANTENRSQANQMTRDSEFWGRFARDVLRSGAEGRRRSCKGGRAVPEVITGWWTDPAGRKHVRIVGRTRQRYTRLRRETELRELPPWWHVYPEAVLGVRGTKDGERYLAVCRCGAVGAPGALGWMGDTCGPCFDRRAEGGTPAGGFGQLAGWSGGLSHFAFTADGRYLIGQSATGAFQKVNREDGTAITLKGKTHNHVAATGLSDAGVVLVMHEGSVFRWRADRDQVERVLPTRQTWGRITVPPNGSRVVLTSYQHASVADLTAARPQYVTVAAPATFTALQFTPDSSQLLAATPTGDICSVNPETLTHTVIRRDVFEGVPGRNVPPSELAISRDGSSVLVRRETYYTRPREATVRHVPLPAGKVVDMRVPEWHRPTTMAYGPDGRHAITAEADGGWVGFWEVASGKSLGFVRAVLEDLAWRSGQIEFTPDGRGLAVSYSTGYDRHGSTIALWPWPDVLSAASAA
jgi:hypothetical protein